MKRITDGFTLLELLIAIAIVAILAAVAVPTYLHYLRTAEFSGTVQAADALKVIVAKCIEKNPTSFAPCTSGQSGIPAAVGAGLGVIGTNVAGGAITAQAPSDARYGVADATYTLTPAYTAGQPITWTQTGTACNNEYVDCD